MDNEVIKFLINKEREFLNEQEIDTSQMTDKEIDELFEKVVNELNNEKN